MFSSRVVQTDESEIAEVLKTTHVEEGAEIGVRANEDSTSLSASDLSDVLKWAQAIASDMNLISCKRTALGPILYLTSRKRCNA